eukprot:CAMPEP_0172520246 /NCGR_PEP_ID=MMETSP1066-20121228/291889_1 /TAXON_ID=671091 /ORGANISM="Coscinodiscus wailesii, Strain CCMP2513" /LENGTH=223 /DNA_ID=CAMNT_0013302971 /DNA_START=205 /DNA_END=877 /DNA_ORIENTATION=-
MPIFRTTGTTSSPLLLRTTTSSSSSSSSSPPPADDEADVVQRLNLKRQFERWAFLQDLLELDVESNADDVNEVVSIVLRSYRHQPLTPAPKTKRERESAAPRISEATREVMNRLLTSRSYDGSGSVGATTTTNGGVLRVFEGEDCLVTNCDIINDLESLLPSDDEDHDAYMSLWDIVIALHGMENVKMSQKEGNKEWDARCVVARFLIHYDFLTEGIIETPSD